MRKNKPIIIGVSGAIGLLTLYFGIVTLANSFSHALEQFSGMWYWITLLVIGFGTQIGLYSYARSGLREKVKGAKAEVAATGTISTGSMIACCAHHVADVLPILGLSAAAVFLVKYQVSLILLGIFSNLVGITMMLSIIQKHRLYSENSILSRILHYNMRTARNVTGILAIIIVSLSFFLSSSGTTDSAVITDDLVKSDEVADVATLDLSVVATDDPMETSAVVEFDLPAKVNDENSVSIEVEPINFSFSRPAQFDISLTTHQGSLDFDLAQVSVLEDDKGNVYQPLNWEGSPPGGHHRNGTLSFPRLENRSRSIKLTIRDVYNAPERVFRWELP